MRTKLTSCRYPISMRVAQLCFLLLALVGAPAFASLGDEGAQSETADAAADSSAQEHLQEADEGESEDTEDLDTRPDAWKALDDLDWQIEESTGLEYHIARLPKIEGAYRFVGENKARFPGGATLEVVDQDEEWLFVKTYRPIFNRKKVITPQNTGPTEEDLAKAAASYPSEVATADRLRLEPFDKGLPRRGQWRNGFDIADMNEDGNLDLVFGPARKGRMKPNIFLGDGAGTWRAWRTTKFAPGPYDYGDAAVGDFNSDGHQDIAFGIHLRGMFVVVGDGKGGFEPYTEGIAFDIPGQGGDATSYSSRQIEVIDWDEDGDLDIIALGEGPKGRKGKRNKITGQVINTSRGFLVYLNQGDGTWIPRGLETVATAQANFADDFAIGDLTGDSRPDLITATRRMGSERILAKQQADGGIVYEALDWVRPDAFVDGVVIDDLDGDGHNDVVVGYRNAELGVWRTGIDAVYWRKDGWERVGLWVSESREGVFAVATGDADGDGRVDVAAMTGDGSGHLFLGDKSGALIAETGTELSSEAMPGCRGFELRMVDFDKDGKDEIVANFAGETVGFPGLAQLNKPGCKARGSVRAWKAFAGQSEPSTP